MKKIHFQALSTLKFNKINITKVDKLRNAGEKFQQS